MVHQKPGPLESTRAQYLSINLSLTTGESVLQFDKYKN